MSRTHNLKELLEQVGARPPQLGVDRLQRFYLFLVCPIAVGMGRHLIEIIRTPPLGETPVSGRKKVDMEDITVEGILCI